FWENLGFPVLVSPVTTPEMVEAGQGLTRSDLCLPIKTYLGHVLWLREKADALFLPRLVSIEAGAYLCPKILGLNDVIRNVIPDLPPIVGPMVNYKGPRRVTLEASFLSLAADLGLPVRRTKEAYRCGLRCLAKAPERSRRGSGDSPGPHPRGPAGGPGSVPGGSPAV
ncbi:MAG: hypothetical protein EHM75_13170, partial [Desulfobacteraceae bacterium]